MIKLFRYYLPLLLVGILMPKQKAIAQNEFIHPGGLHTIEDLNRMKKKVAEGAHPWSDGWNRLIQDPLAQNTYEPKPQNNLGKNRVSAVRDANAAYLNAIRWYVSGDDSYADCAINILNAWSATVDQQPSGGEIWGLGGISISAFALAAEVIRVSDRWEEEDFERFKSMMLNYFYPMCSDFLKYHHEKCIDFFWANWDANNILALVSIGVLCDNKDIYNEGIDYFYNGRGTGSIKHAVYHIHENGLGQWQESGRDQEHGQLGVGILGYVCQVAWNQGLDLFSYDNNRLLAGAEYTAKYNQNQEVPFKFYNNCQPANNKWPSTNGRGRLDDRPVWELLYNHYVVHQGLSAPYTQRMAELMRPEHGSIDHFGYGTLTFTLQESKYPPHPVPGKPTGLKANAGTGKVFLTWGSPRDYTATGYVIQRSEKIEGDYSTIDTRHENTSTVYVDRNVTNGTIYHYRVAALNQSGIGIFSSTSSATPLAAGELPAEWKKVDIGTEKTGAAKFAKVSGSTFVVSSYGTHIGGTNESATYCYTNVSGNYEITGRISETAGSLAKSGIMIRESLAPASPCVTLTLGEGGGRFARMGYRKTTSGPTFSELGNTYTWLPAWFRIQRKGNVFTAYESSDGEKWFEVGSVDFDMEKQYYIGLVVSSGNDKRENTTTFDHVNINKIEE